MTTININENINSRIYNVVVSNIRTVGNKRFANIPIDMLYYDPKYQRVDTVSMAKINGLAAHWDSNRMDPIRVSARPDEGRFAVLDGMHRARAAEIKGEDSIVAEVLEFDCSPEERIIKEATIFACQNDDVETLSPSQKHNANIVRGVKANIDLDKAIKKYGVQLKSNQHGRGKTGTLSGFADALGITNVCGLDMIEDIFNIICSSRWSDEVNGFSSITLTALKNVLLVHQDIKDVVIPATIDYFRTITPNMLLAYGKANYPIRSDRAAMTLAYDDFLSNKLNIPMSYAIDGDKLVRVAA